MLIDFIETADASQITVLVEELLRFASPLQYTIRTNNSELTIGDLHIPANTKLYLCLASANRDPEKFENPDLIDPIRKNNTHLSFGAGTHFCAGAPLARQELKYCLKPMLEFLKNYKIDTNSLIWSKQIFMRTLKNVTVSKF
jgi:cytochrome P450